MVIVDLLYLLVLNQLHTSGFNRAGPIVGRKLNYKGNYNNKRSSKGNEQILTVFSLQPVSL